MVNLKLREAVAIKVMGWRTSTISDKVWYAPDLKNSIHKDSFCPDMDTAAIWLVVDRMKDLGFGWRIESLGYGEDQAVRVSFGKEGELGYHDAVSSDVGEAVCEAAVAARRAEEKLNGTNKES